MKTYLQLGEELLAKYNRLYRDTGNFRADRTNTGTVSVFGRQVRYDLRKGFPLVTTKFVPLRMVIAELIWFLAGDTNNNTLLEQNVRIWNEWAIESGELGPVYGAQWRSWPNPRAREVHEYSVLERYNLAWARLLAGENVSYSEAQLGHLQRAYGLFPEVAPLEERAADKSMLKRVHQLFASWAIPKTVVTEHPIDQISEVIRNLKKKPYSRRHIVSAWNVADLPDESISPQENVRLGKMALAPCHTLFHFYVEDLTAEERVAEAKRMGFKGYEHEIDFAFELMDQMDRDGVPRKRLDCQLYQRSADYCLGVPFNIASYALLTMMVAQCVDMVPGEFIHTFGDLHIYSNHIPKFEYQLQREPYRLPKIRINPAVRDIFSFKLEDFELVDYAHHPQIDFGKPAV